MSSLQLLLNVRQSVLVYLLVHLGVAQPSQQLHDMLADLARLACLVVPVADESDVAEDQHIAQNEPEDQERVDVADPLGRDAQVTTREHL